MLGPTLESLRPAARALGPSLRQTRPFLRESTPIIRDELRPFTRAALPTVKELRPAMRDLAATTPDLTRSVTVLNQLLNAAAYNPPGAAEEGMLFWQSWVNHTGNSLFSTADAHGPIRRGLFLVSCNSAQLLDAVAQANPQLGTLVELLNAPAQQTICPTSTQGPAAGGGAPTTGGRLIEHGQGRPLLRQDRGDGAVRAVVLRAAAVPVARVRRPGAAEAEGLPLPHVVRRSPASSRLEADVRISGVPVGKVKKITPNKRTGRSDVVIQLQSRYAPLPSDARAILRQKTLLGETYVELTPGRNSAQPIPEGGALASTQVSETVELDEILRSFDPETRADFQQWMQTQAQAIGGRGQDLNDALGNLAPFAEDTATIVDVLNRQEEALSQLVANTGIVFQRAVRARRPAAIADRELQHRVRDHRVARRGAAGRVPRAADVRGRVAQDVRAPGRVPARRPTR